MTGKRLKVLIIGGYGMFGGRLTRLLSSESRVEVLVAGRSLSKATDFCQSISGPARLTPTRLDRNKAVADRIAELGPDMVVDASGPWQSYGSHPYQVARAAIRNSAHYLDIADDRTFVLGITELDAEAKRHGVAVLSGASTCPALSGAVSRQLSSGLNRVHSLTGGIAPSPFVPMGRSVIEAIAGYAGKSLAVWKGGSPGTATALVSSRDFTIAPPGTIPLPRLRFSLVDVPDLDALRMQSVPVDSVWFGVATRPAIFQRGLRWLATGVNRGWIRSLSALAPSMQWVTNRLSWGEHRGGMYMRVVGENHAGRIEDRSWHLVAAGDSGPCIPLLASVVVIRRILNGTSPSAGARAAIAEFALDDFQPLFDALDIETGQKRSDSPPEAPLFEKILGDAWDQLPSPVREAHQVKGEHVLEGNGKVLRGKTLLSRIIARVFGFPTRAGNASIRVRMRRSKDVETWRRDFDGHRFSSSLLAGKGKTEGLIIERFGPVAIAMALSVDGRVLRYTPRHWSFAGIPLPPALLPRGDMFETVEDGRFRFHVNVRLPVAGRVVTYEGFLQPAA